MRKEARRYRSIGGVAPSILFMDLVIRLFEFETLRAVALMVAYFQPSIVALFGPAAAFS